MKLFITLTLSFLLFNQTVAQGQTTIAIVGSTLIDGTGKAPLPHAVVLVEGDRITTVGTVETAPIPRHARRIDAPFMIRTNYSVRAMCRLTVI